MRVSVCVKNLKINKGSFPSLYQAPKNCKKYQGAKYMVRNNNKKTKLKAVTITHFGLTQLAFTCSKLTKETLEQCVKYVQS